MGILVKASCPCGYKTDILYVGGGFSDTKDSNKQPAYCSQCNQLFLANYSKNRQKCRKCRTLLMWYNDPMIFKKENDGKIQEIYRWDNFSLPYAKFLCPRCGEMTMDFFDMGFWD